MKRLFLVPSMIMALLVMVILPVTAQQNYSLAGKSEFIVSGTSTIHDWEMPSEGGANGKAKMKIENGKLVQLGSLTLEVPVESLKSGKNAMDKNAYEALSSQKHPYVKFELTEVTQITADQVKAKGKLTIAGNTQPVTMQTNYRIDGNTVQFTGTQQIKFSQFSLKPPSAVFNTIKTGDQLEITYKANFSQLN